MLKEDLPKVGAKDLHDLMRVWEVWNDRGDFPKLDETNWKCFTTSRYDADKNEWSLQKKPSIALIP